MEDQASEEEPFECIGIDIKISIDFPVKVDHGEHEDYQPLSIHDWNSTL